MQLAPATIVTGGNDFLTRLLNTPSIPAGTSPQASALREGQMSLSNLLKLRANFTLWGANHTIELALKRPLRSGATCTYKPLDQVQVWDAKLKIWQNGVRLMTETGPNSVVERGHRVIRVPALWIRPMKALLD